MVREGVGKYGGNVCKSAGARVALGVLGAEGRAPCGASKPRGLVGGRIGILVLSGGFTGALRVGSYLRRQFYCST